MDDDDGEPQVSLVTAALVTAALYIVVIALMVV